MDEQENYQENVFRITAFGIYFIVAIAILCLPFAISDLTSVRVPLYPQ